MNNRSNDLELLLKTEMPFGKYQGRPLIDLPEDYVVWFHTKGLPEGKLGHLLGLLYECICFQLTAFSSYFRSILSKTSLFNSLKNLSNQYSHILVTCLHRRLI